MKVLLKRVSLCVVLLMPVVLLESALVARAASCFIHSNCVYDLNTEDGDDLLVYGERVKFVACFSGKGTTRLEVREDRRWRLAARSSRVTIDVRRCGRKFKYRHVYSWQVDVLPPGSEKLQMRLVSGNWKRLWVSPVAESEQEVLDGASWLVSCVERTIAGLPCN